MSRTTIILIASLLLSACMALWGWAEVSRYRGLYTDSQTALTQAQAQAKRIQLSVSKVNHRNAELRVSLDAALRSNRDWADVRIPDAVRDSLCARANCARLQPVPTPAD